MSSRVQQEQPPVDARTSGWPSVFVIWLAMASGASSALLVLLLDVVVRWNPEEREYLIATPFLATLQLSLTGALVVLVARRSRSLSGHLQKALALLPSALSSVLALLLLTAEWWRA